MNATTRLKEYLEIRGINNRRAERECGLSNGLIKNALKANSSLGGDKLENILNTYTDLSAEWLLTGKGAMTVSEDTSRTTTATSATPIKNYEIGVPYYNVDFNTGFLLMENDQTQTPDYLINCPPYNKCDFWCNAHGESMSPTISSGDIVALQKIDDFRYLISGEIYAIITRNGLRTIKRVNDLGKNIELIPDNRDFQPQTLPKSEITHVFAVKGAMKTF